MRIQLFVVMAFAPALLSVAQTKRALLIGINTYQPAGTVAEHGVNCAYGRSLNGRCALGKFENLQGAMNDAQSMADLLTSPKFGFPADNVVLLTNPAAAQPRPGVVVLPAAETDRAGILAAMQKYLVDMPQPGDTVVFYDASHGSLRVNTKGTKITVLLNGQLVHADSTLVASDAYKGGFDVEDREMTRIFDAALDKGIHLTVILDSCYSGATTRGLGEARRARSLAFDERDMDERPDLLPDGTPRPSPTERAGNPALVFAAAQQDQEADEADPTPTQPESHGAFTEALIESLQVLPVDTPASLVYERVKAVLEGNNLPQEPDLDATAARRGQPLFGSSGSSAGGTDTIRTAALKIDDDGNVWLDVGRVSGVGVGSEFTAMRKNSKGQTVKLRVSQLEGISRTTAKVVLPPGAKVTSGDVFQLTKWVPAQTAPLHFGLWPANLAEDDVIAAAAAVKDSGVVSVGDPADEVWTDTLWWDGTNWELQHAAVAAAAGPTAAINLDQKPGAAVSLGPKLTAEGLRQHVPAGAKLWVNLPPSRELAAKLTLHDNNSAVQAAPDLASADYILTGAITEDGPSYTWFHKSDFDAGPPVSATKNHSPGCSTTSPYPVRVDWVALPDVAVVGDAAGALNESATQLAKLNGWFQLAHDSGGASTGAYYRLALRAATGTAEVPTGQPLHQGEAVELALESTAAVTERRWVYVLDINCYGEGTLLYPHDLGENEFPSDAANGPTIVLHLPQALSVSAPYGVETLLLLSTAQPLADPSALNFKGVITRGARAAGSPLEQLLTGTSGGTRALTTEAIPTNWGLDVMTLHSVPSGGPN